jgi:hypothetical protein
MAFGTQGIDTSSPASQTTQTSTPNIQPWAQPYISNYLNATQNLIANQQTPELLNQSYVGAAGLQLPGGFASGSALAEAGGRGSLSTAPIALQYGQQGAQYGAQGTKYGDLGSTMGIAASRAGDMYAQQAQSPEAMKAYMSPYMQNVVDYQKEQAVRDYQIQAPQMAAQAVGSGAFGGNRLTLQQAEANRGLQNRLAGIDATGQQQAFQAAQQAQQFGAGLGLQGLQAGMQGQQVGLQGLGTAMQGSQVGLQGVSGAQQGYAGATQAGGTLGNIAAQQAQAKLAQLQLQNQFGLQQQQFPYQQQQYAQAMMSNLPFQSASQTNQQYTSPPNLLNQGLNLGLGALGAYTLYKAFNKGGSVQGYADGGQAQGMEEGLADNVRPMGQMAPTGYGLSEMVRSDIAPMGAGVGPAFGGSNEDYVNSLYANMLGRQADQGGYQHNLDLLNSGKVSAQDLAGAFRNSAEGQRMPSRNALMGAGMPAASGLADIRLNQLLG